MNLYLVDITFKDFNTEEFLFLIPKQRKIISELVTNGKIISCSLAEDRSKLWIVMLANNEFETRITVNSFPLRIYMDFDIHKLVFNSNSISKIMPLSLN